MRILIIILVCGLHLNLIAQDDQLITLSDAFLYFESECQRYNVLLQEYNLDINGSTIISQSNSEVFVTDDYTFCTTDGLITIISKNVQLSIDNKQKRIVQISSISNTSSIGHYKELFHNLSDLGLTEEFSKPNDSSVLTVSLYNSLDRKIYEFLVNEESKQLIRIKNYFRVEMPDGTYQSRYIVCHYDFYECDDKSIDNLKMNDVIETDNTNQIIPTEKFKDYEIIIL